MCPVDCAVRREDVGPWVLCISYSGKRQRCPKKSGPNTAVGPHSVFPPTTLKSTDRMHSLARKVQSGAVKGDKSNLLSDTSVTRSVTRSPLSRTMSSLSAVQRFWVLNGGDAFRLPNDKMLIPKELSSDAIESDVNCSGKMRSPNEAPPRGSRMTHPANSSLNLTFHLVQRVLGLRGRISGCD